MRKFVLSLAVLGALGLAGQPYAHATPNVTGVKLSAGYEGYHLHYK